MPDVRSCPACASVGAPSEFDLIETMFGLDKSFRYGSCPDCASVYILDVPEDLANYYSSELYYSFEPDPQSLMGRPGVAHGLAITGRSVLFGHNVLGTAVRHTLRARQVQTAMSLFASIRLAGLPRGRESRVLDVGCGSGTLVYALSLVGLPEVTGVDPFGVGRVFDTGARVLQRDLSEVEGEYDLIMLHHALEHVPAPRETMSKVRGLLSPGGRALVRMPTVSSLAYERYGANWMQLDPPRHLTVFSRLGMQRMCDDIGLLIKEIRDDSTAFQFWASEQAGAGIPLVAETSHFVNPSESMFSTAQIRAWEKEAAVLNAQGRGDQAAWVLTSA